MADYEFKAASRDGYGMDWAVTYADMSPYYDRVESFIGVSGARRRIAAVSRRRIPAAACRSIARKPSSRRPVKSLGWPTTPRRLAQLTRMLTTGRLATTAAIASTAAMWAPCSTPSAVTLPPALKTGNLEVRTDSVVAQVRMNGENRAQGVTYIERFTRRPSTWMRKYVILAASTFENTRLLLLSAKGGLANSSGTLGQYMMDQVGGGGVTGFLPKLKGGPSRLDDGKSAGITIPNFQNIDKKTARKDFIRGYVMNATGGQTEYPQFAASLPGYGSAWKKEVKCRYVAQARVWIAGGEMLARKENFVELDPEVKDHWGIPVLKIHFTHCDNDRKIIADFQARRRAIPQSGR